MHDAMKIFRDNIANGHTLVTVLMALSETRVISELHASQTAVTAAALSHSLRLDPTLVDACLSYIAFASDLVEKHNDGYLLTPNGRDWLLADPFVSMVNKFIAYQCIHSTMTEALRGEKVYGRDMQRSGRHVARFSEIGTRRVIPWLAAALQGLGAKMLVDLGCGSGQLLSSLCAANLELRGIGIDIDALTVSDARARVASLHLDDRVRVIAGDLTRPESFAAEAEEADVFHCGGALHEFLAIGKGPVVALLKTMRSLFPGRHFILVEVERLSDAVFRDMAPTVRTSLLYHQFIMHPFTHQALPPRETWLSIFQAASIECVSVDSIGTPMVAYTLRL